MFYNGCKFVRKITIIESFYQGNRITNLNNTYTKKSLMNFSDIQKNYFEIFEISWKMPLIDAQSSICNYSKN